MSSRLLHILRTEVIHKPSDFRITYFDQNLNYKRVNVNTLELIDDTKVRINAVTTISIDNVYLIENRRLKTVRFERNIVEVTPQPRVWRGVEIIDDEDQKYIKYPSSKNPRHINHLDFLRQSLLFYDSEQDSDDFPSLGVRVLLRLFESAYPIDSLYSDPYVMGNSYFPKDFLVQHLTEIRSLGLIKYVVFDEVEGGGSYYAITPDGAEWIIKQITGKFEQYSVLIGLLARSPTKSLPRQFFFTKFGHLTTQIDPLFFLLATFPDPSSQKKAYKRYLEDVEARSPREIQRLMSEQILNDKIRELISGKLVGLTENEGIKPTALAQETLGQVSNEISMAVQKLKSYTVIEEAQGEIKITAFGEEVVKKMTEAVEKRLEESDTVVLSFSKEMTPRDRLTELLQSTRWDHFFFVSALLLLIFAILLTSLQVPLGAGGCVLASVLCGILSYILSKRN